MFIAAWSWCIGLITIESVHKFTFFLEIDTASWTQCTLAKKMYLCQTFSIGGFIMFTKFQSTHICSYSLIKKLNTFYFLISFVASEVRNIDV